MVIINNQEMKKAFSDSTKCQMLEQPNQIDNSKVIPVLDVTPRTHKYVNLIKAGSTAAATNASLYVTSTGNKDFYITAANLSFIKDAGSTATAFWIQANVDGAQVNILNTASFSGTVDSKAITISFPYPIKVDRGSNIRVFADTFVANQRITGTVYGYEVEVI